MLAVTSLVWYCLAMAVPFSWCSWRITRDLPDGRAQVGDRHLKIYESGTTSPGRFTLVKQGNAVWLLDPASPPILSLSGTHWSTNALVKAGVVGATGFEPVTPSVSDPTSHYRPVHRRVRDR